MLRDWKCALLSVIAAKGVEAAKFVTPDEVEAQSSLYSWLQVLGPEALRQAHFPVWEGGLGLESSAEFAGTACLSFQVFAVGCVLTAASASRVPALLERPPERPLAKELIAALQCVVEVAAKGQLKDAVSIPWAAVAIGR